MKLIAYCRGVISFIIATARYSEALNITAVIYGIPSREMISGLPSILPGYFMVFEELRVEYGFEIEENVITSPDIRSCDDIATYVYLIPEFYYTKRRAGFLFLLFYIGCDEILQLSSLSAEWNTLIIGSGGWTGTTASSNSLETSKNSAFATTIPLSVYSYPQIVRAAFALLTLYSWTSVAVVHVDHPTFIGLQAMMKRIHSDLYSRINLSYYFLDTNAEFDYLSLFVRIKRTSRVILLLMPAQTIGRFMIAANEDGLTGGEYVFISLEPFENESRYGSIEYLDYRQIAQQTLLQLTPNCSFRNPTTELHIMDVLKNESVTKHGAVFWPNEKPQIALSVYHTVQAVGYILNESLHAGTNLFDGKGLANSFADRNIGLDTTVLRTDPDRALVVDFCVKDYHPEKGCFTPVLNYDGARGRFTVVADRKINWHRNPVDGAPPNEPLCGFHGNSLRCETRNNSRLLIDISTALVTLMLIGVLIAMHQHRARSAKKKEVHWKVDVAKLVFPSRRCVSSTSSNC